MIDAMNDELLTLAEAAKRLPSRPCVMSIFRWVKSGRLAAVRVGSRWFTTDAALAEFVARCNPTISMNGSPPETIKDRERRLSKAKKQLFELGLRS